MNTRNALRAAVVVGTVPLVQVLASPAFAIERDDGDDPGPGMSWIMAVLIYGLIPLALFALLALLVYLPSAAHGPRYRPGLGWWAAPVWFGGPERAETAIAAAVPTTDGGGASARW
ncbi:MAG: hypothetical protein M3Q27_10505 [Actinomycetota bacterium]|nr:hypothetical protein [Actinomycetota bacterium]